MLRLTKFLVFGTKDKNSKFTVISTNKTDPEFIKSLEIEKVIWCINPLVKYYDETKKTLDSIKTYTSAGISERKSFLNF